VNKQLADKERVAAALENGSLIDVSLYIHLCIYPYVYSCVRMYVFMYVSMYVCMYVCGARERQPHWREFMYTWICIYICIYVCMFVYIHVCMYVCIYVCGAQERQHYWRGFMYRCEHMFICIYTYLCMYVFMYVCMYIVCMYSCMYVCIYVCLRCSRTAASLTCDMSRMHGSCHVWMRHVRCECLQCAAVCYSAWHHSECAVLCSVLQCIIVRGITLNVSFHMWVSHVAVQRHVAFLCGARAAASLTCECHRLHGSRHVTWCVTSNVNGSCRCSASYRISTGRWRRVASACRAPGGARRWRALQRGASPLLRDFFFFGYENFFLSKNPPLLWSDPVGARRRRAKALRRRAPPSRIHKSPDLVFVNKLKFAVVGHSSSTAWLPCAISRLY